MSSLPWQGIRIRIHFLFWIVILWSVLTGRFIEIVTLFVLVIIHELGHLTAAWSHGWRVTALELLPFGGVARTDEWGTAPAREEIVVALAGPFHNVMMVLAGFLFYFFGLWTEEWTAFFVKGNAMLAGFNLLPIYPLDGGRILQALLSYVLPYRRCLDWSFKGSLFLSLGLLFLGLFGSGGEVHLNLVIVALFLCHANWTALKQRELQYMRFLIQRRDRPHDGGRMIRLPVSSEDRLLAVLRRWRKEVYHVMEVFDLQGRHLGCIPEEVVLKRFFEGGNPRMRIGELLG
ncbi:stage IV sporulation protein FB [Planifilum fimeticola]|uniref:Stage IV sporulation protein FB n=1 Tax=Planifilum fimeticola TaxID=201975 RepID=A0A2T0LBX8_9BACL|nr:M50 family metallopeptidase [Planifilum fimeticola]PRX39437.1 stage IV sporulation protein FB [Planifilum fimeticola]